MRLVLLLCLIVLSKYTNGYLHSFQPIDEPNENNVFIITLDGFRWQELFHGADSALINDPAYTSDTAAIKKMYWDEDGEKRREKLMPFFWTFVSAEGQLFGNRSFGNCVDVSNIYRLSYPGYNEILTGKTDLRIFSNERKTNKNKTLLEYLNALPAYHGKIAAFASWNLFNYILRKDRNKLYVNCNVDEKSFQQTLKTGSIAAHLYPKFYDEAQNTRNDWLTLAMAQQYIVQRHPKVVYIGLGGTDEYGHQKKYGDYLQQAHQADKIIERLWNLVQSNPFYRNNTTFVITTDHGRGETKSTWHKHGFLTRGSSETWLALLGNGIAGMGEHKQKIQLYQRQLAGTVGSLLGVRSYRNESIPVSYFSVPRP